MAITIARRPAGRECAAILSELPEWFGLPESNIAYAEAAEREPAWIAEEDGVAVGVLVLADTGFSAVDVHLLAVRPGVHRQGVGRILINHARQFARERGKTFLTVKTRGPSAPYEPYERTRMFYEGVGFVGLEEIIEVWGPENPCLIMIHPL